MTRLFSLVVLAVAMVGITQGTHAAAVLYVTNLSGANEPPTPVPSPGTGFATVGLDLAAHTLSVNVTFSGLTTGTTASHIHGPPTPGVGSPPFMVATTTPTFPNFPLGVTSGTYSQVFNTLDPTTYNPAFIAAVAGGTVANAEAVLAADLAAGNSYLNIHTVMFPGGEISGFLAPIPEPASFTLLAIGAISLLFAGRRARHWETSGNRDGR